MIIRQDTALEYEASPLIASPHAFPTRLGGASGGALASLNLGQGRGDSPAALAENYARLGRAVGFDPARCVLTRQVHGDVIRRVTAADPAGLDAPRPDCDALITDVPGTALVIFTADGIPVRLYDPDPGAVGAAHCGWRGTALGLAEKTARAMAAAFGSRPESLRCAIGPGIGPCCFETDGDVPAAMRAALGEAAAPFLRPVGAKWHVDLKGINRLWLQRAGVRTIDCSDSCTACRTDRFWSHRRMGAARGSQGAVIVCKEVAK